MKTCKSSALLYIFLLAFCSASLVSFAQDPVVNLEQGLKPYGSYHGGDLDTVNITNGNLNLHIPLLSYPQRGGKLELAWDISYANRSWIQAQYQNPAPPGQLTDWWQWRGQGVQVVLTKQYGQNYFLYTVPPSSGNAGDKVHVWTLYSADGTSHSLDGRNGGGLGSGMQYAMDGTGLQSTPSAAGAVGTVIESNGVVYTDTAWTDPNGNQIAISGSTISDTIGRTISTAATPDSGWTLLPLPWGASPPNSANLAISGQTAAPGTATSTSGCPTGSVSARAWTVPGYNNGSTSTATYTICYGQYSLSTNFGVSGVNEGTSTDRFINAIILPNGTSWTFGYNDAYGDLTSLGLPTGGSISYTWGTTQACGTGGAVPTPLARYVMTRTVFDGTNSHQWTYNRNAPGVTGTLVTDPDGNDTVYTHDCFYVSQVDTYQGSHNSGTLLKTVKTQFPAYGCPTYPVNPYENPYDNYTASCSFINVLPQSVTTILNPGSSSQVASEVVKTYDTGQAWQFINENSQATTNYSTLLGKVVEEDEHDFGATGSSTPGGIIRSVFTNYAWQSPAPHFGSYLSANLLDYPVSKITKDGSGNRVAETDYVYDSVCSLNGLLTVGVSVGFVAAPNGSYRGNPMSVTHWLNTGTSPTVETAFNNDGTKYRYYDADNVVAGHGCTTTYTDQYSYSSTYQYAYLTGTTDALGHTVSAQYDFNTGAMTSFTDQNTRQTTYAYDKLVRPIQVLYPLESASGLQGESDITYHETAMPFSMDLKQRIDSTNWKQSTTVFDGLGRVTQAQQSPQLPTYTEYVDTAYDNEGRVFSVSNPYRTGDTEFYTKYVYDALGRKCVEFPQDAVISSLSCPTTSVPNPGSNDVLYSYAGSSVTVTDQTSRTHETVSNALGWLTQVIENPSQGTFNGNSYFKYETDYFYDTLGNMYCAVQKGNAVGGVWCPSAPGPTNPFSTLSTNGYHGRWSVYDSLSRLTDSYNPETGHTNWTYDANGNVLTKTDNKSQKITYSYDAENRVTGKTYTNPTAPAVTYNYDQVSANGLSITNGTHHRTSMSDASGSTAWSFDERGREITEQRTIGTVTKTITTVHDVLGLATSLVYPNGTTLTYGYDWEGRTANITDSAHSINYAGSLTTGAQCTTASSYAGVCYTAAGVPSSYYVGYVSGNSGMGVSFSDQYDSRLKPANFSSSIARGTTVSYQYNYNLGTANNGDIVNFTDQLNSANSKNYYYDAYNRISQYKSPSGTTWNVVYTIDAWGNLTNKTTQPGYGGETFNGGAANNANQFTSGYSYDLNGNVTGDGSHTYGYDSENRINTLDGNTNYYVYDGDGERVQKSSGETYWGGGAGSALLETDNAGNPVTEYIYMNGKRIARRDVSGTPAVSIYITDDLGSTAAIADATGSIKVRYDYAPYGEIHSTVGGDSGNHYKFTGKERDNETGNDYFGARYYQSAMGRFITPDWSATPAAVPYANLAMPQTLNLYAYVANNPVTGIDPDGHLANGWMEVPRDMGKSGDWDDEPTQMDSEDSSLSGVLNLQSLPPSDKQIQGQVAPNPPQVDQNGNPVFNPAPPKPPAMGTPAHVYPVEEELQSTGAIQYTYQVVDKDWKPICCVSVKEHIEKLASTSANVTIKLNPKYVAAFDGRFVDYVGPMQRPGQNDSFQGRSIQTFSVMTDTATYKISTTILQSTTVSHGHVEVNANIVKP